MNASWPLSSYPDYVATGLSLKDHLVSLLYILQKSVTKVERKKLTFIFEDAVGRVENSVQPA
jgi:archaellum component FlaD/FlaE